MLTQLLSKNNKERPSEMANFSYTPLLRPSLPQSSEELYHCSGVRWKRPFSVQRLIPKGHHSIDIEQLVGVKTQLSLDVESALEEVEKSLSEPQAQFHSQYRPVFKALVEKLYLFRLIVFTPPTCSVSTLILLSLKYTLCPPEELQAEHKRAPPLPSR